MNHSHGLFDSPTGMEHDRFLLDTYADRRAEEKPSRTPRWLRAVVKAVKR